MDGFQVLVQEVKVTAVDEEKEDSRRCYTAVDGEPAVALRLIPLRRQ